MHEWSHEILSRLAALNLSPVREAEIIEEVAQHLEDRYQELVAAGAKVAWPSCVAVRLGVGIPG